MFSALMKKFREAFVSVLPVTAIVFIINLFPVTDFSSREMLVFALSSLFLVIGISLFNLGADMAMSPMGEYVGAGLAGSRRIVLLIAVCFGMGALITVAEPDLSVLAEQVKNIVSPTVLILSVALGVGVFLAVSVMKIVFKRNLSELLMFAYLLLFSAVAIAAENGNSGLLSLAFDSGGVTTGPITVPFIMALGVGIAATLGGKNVGENSFGLIAMCSVGPMIAVTLLGAFSKGGVEYKLPDYSLSDDILHHIGDVLLETLADVSLAVGLILIFFIGLQIFVLKLPMKKLLSVGIGIIYTVSGLIVFLSAVTVGFMPIGYKMGTELARSDPWLTVVFAFVIGAVVVLAEPAVHVLNRQVEEITSGTVSKRSMMAALCIGVGISIALSVIRIIFGFSILYYLIPGYILSLGLSFFVPGIYTAIAFDSGGVASGPLTSTFILPFAVGLCAALQGEAKVITDAFGVVAMVAMTPLITIQTLGFRAVMTSKLRQRIAVKRILASDDEQIINFM